MKKLLRNDVFIGSVLALGAFVIYLLTLAPSLWPMDSGELAAAATTLGIAHPTGYPLFTLLEWAFAHVPWGSSVIRRLNLTSALFSAGAVFVLYRFLVDLLPKTPAASAKRSPPSTGGVERLAAASAVLILAFSRTYWTQALSLEVYPLHLLLLSLALFLFLRALREEKNAGPGSNAAWYGFAFVLGLGFAHHLTIILLAPGLLYLYFATYGFGRPAWTRLGKAFPCFLLGLSPYLYLPLRAAHDPLINWGNPETFTAFWGHVSGEEFRPLMFSSLDAAFGKLGNFLGTLPSEFGYLPLGLVIPGWWRLYRRSGRMLVFSLLLFGGCVFYAINYGIRDIESYYLLAYLAVAVWMAHGAQTLLDGAGKGRGRQAAAVLCGLLALLPFGLHYRQVDESRDYAVEDFAKNMLNSLDSGAVIFTDQFPVFSSAARYLQWVEGVRPDVIVLEVNALALPGSYRQLERQHPDFARGLPPTVRILLRGSEDLDSVTLVARHGTAVRQILEKSLATRPVYITLDVDNAYVNGFHGIPQGLALRIYRDSVPAPVPPRVFSFRPFSGSDPYLEDIRAAYAAAYVNQGVYRGAILKDTATAIALLRKALEVKPGYLPAMRLLGRTPY